MHLILIHIGSGEIERDVERTFPALAFFSEDSDGRRQLGNVLKATAVHAPEVAYCQVPCALMRVF